MSWKNVKNLLIVLLLAVNVVLMMFAYNYFLASRFTDGETAAMASAVLAKNDIKISADKLAVQKDTADVLFCAYDREHYLALAASLLLGKEADGIYMLPNGIRAETLEGDTVLLGYDMSIDYKNFALADEINAALDGAKPMDADASKQIRTALEELIALPENSLEGAKCTSFGDYTFITAEQFENSLSLYDMTCVFGIKNGKIVYAGGKHFFGVPEGKEAAQLLDRVNIMFSEKQRGEAGTVSDISLCYTLYEDSQTDRMLFIPSYKITYEDGKTNTVNALSKEKY